ncbi:hypothetical protein N7582_003845 [Saccharomyces uvarum]|uniref:Nudix hydrolase domain-containing protein n=1 Tax=Saccharomyces uvarum TaxID=230603 RepID=A0AA35J2M2_SACUV|nr:hypothetical protein N7582_003845 [Saccharomyces uvarum]CAI4046573.1 hypothetical protein SUVC_12G2060 [Saccharomyces uvarum]
MLGSKQLIENLIRFKFHKTPYTWSSIWPFKRNSAVIILLFIGMKGELRVLLTKRSRTLRSFSGDVSFPGGKADFFRETFENVARREAEEEIGLPHDSEILHNEFGMRLENLIMDMPCYLSRTFLSVKPIVCFLYKDKLDKNEDKYKAPLDISKFFGKLNPGETSSLFSVPLNDLIVHLLPKDDADVKNYRAEYFERKEYKRNWGGVKWLIMHYHFHVANNNEMPWLQIIEDLSSSDEGGPDGDNGIFKFRDLWGLTCKMLFDVSCIANGLMDDKSKRELGHEDLIVGLHDYGNQMQINGRSEWEIGMINGDRNLKYSDVIPEYYMKHLIGHRSLW